MFKEQVSWMLVMASTQHYETPLLFSHSWLDGTDFLRPCFSSCTARMHNMRTITIFECEVKLHETDPRQVLEVKCGGGSVWTLRLNSDSQDKLISAL